MQLERLNYLSATASSLCMDHGLETPFLLFDEKELLDTISPFKEYMPGVKLYYAVKANPSEHILKFFRHQGLSFDVSSSGEINSLTKLGISGNDLLLTAPIKDKKTLYAMFENKVKSCAVDNISEIDKISKFRKDFGYTFAPQIFIRIKVESVNVEVDLNTKFGCSLSEALTIIEHASKQNFSIAGICFHVGTQSTTADNYFFGIRSAMLVANEAKRRFNIQIPVINIGGGFCDTHTAEKAGVSLPEFYSRVGSACKEAQNAGFEVIAEPGRCLVSSAGTLVTSVIGLNTRNEKQWAYLDDGIYGCFSIKLYENHPFQFYPISNWIRKNVQLAESTQTQWTIAGPTCDSLDVVAHGIDLPSNLQIGQMLLVPNLGAYTISTASNFNGFSVPRCFVVRTSQKRGRGINSELCNFDSMLDNQTSNTVNL